MASRGAPERICTVEIATFGLSTYRPLLPQSAFSAGGGGQIRAGNVTQSLGRVALEARDDCGEWHNRSTEVLGSLMRFRDSGDLEWCEAARQMLARRNGN